VDKEVYALPFDEESDGTQKLLNLIPAIMHSNSESKVFIIDEVDRSLHPLLTKLVIQFFTQAKPDNGSQLIVTTHDTHLLDQSLVRRDEIWFTEKDDSQQTNLYPLTDMTARNDLRIEKGYLQGRFGGIPFLATAEVIEKILDIAPSR